MRWNGKATVSHERGDAPVTMIATARQNAALPVVDRWCRWLKDVEVMAEQLWPRQIGQRGYGGGERLRRCTASSARSFGKAE